MPTDSNAAPAFAKGAESPLSPGQLLDYSQAETSRKVLSRTLSVAKMDAQLTTFFALIAIASAYVSDGSALAIGSALALVAFNSWRGYRKLRRMDPPALHLLALNQLLLAACLTAYFLWCIYDIHVHHGSNLIPDMDPGDLKTLGFDIETLKLWEMGIYGICILGTVVGQGLMALYYLSRRKRLAAYLSQTPKWILDLQRAQQN